MRPKNGFRKCQQHTFQALGAYIVRFSNLEKYGDAALLRDRRWSDRLADGGIKPAPQADFAPPAPDHAAARGPRGKFQRGGGVGRQNRAEDAER